MLTATHIEFVVHEPPLPKGRPRFRIMFDRAGLSEIISCVSRGELAGLGTVLRKVVNVQTYTPPETEAAEQAFRLLARKHRPRKPIAGPLRVDTIFVVAAPQKFPADRSRIWPHVKPDDDNYRKLVLDALNGEFWHDDGQVCGGSSFKVYGHPARTLVRIRPLTLEDYETVLRELGEEPAQPALFGGTNA